jgi:hypothetical protein
MLTRKWEQVNTERALRANCCAATLLALLGAGLLGWCSKDTRTNLLLPAKSEYKTSGHTDVVLNVIGSVTVLRKKVIDLDRSDGNMAGRVDVQSATKRHRKRSVRKGA